MNRNADLFARAQQLLPGGVNSPVRAFKSVGGEPFFAVRAEGPYLWDADGERYIDYIGSWGPMILGHAHPDVLDAVVRTAAHGLSFGVPKIDVEARLMKKCNLCYDRTSQDLKPWCAQACPTQAITFGNLIETTSKVAKLKGLDLNYGLLSELNTKPRTTYLGRVRNPNPELQTGLA